MTIRLAADTIVLLLAVAIALVVLGATLHTIVDAVRHRH